MWEQRPVHGLSLPGGPSRPLPRVGAAALIVHFGGERERAVVVAVHEGGRRLEVRGEGGELHRFALSPATARFVSEHGRHGPRLALLAS